MNHIIKWEEMACPDCGADGIVRHAQDGDVIYPETEEAPIFCQVCGWEGRAAEAKE